MNRQNRCKFGLQCSYLLEGRCKRWHPIEHLVLCNNTIFLIARRESDIKHVEFIYQQQDYIEVSPIQSLYRSIINLKEIQDQQSHYYEAKRKHWNKIEIKRQLPDRQAVKIILSSMFQYPPLSSNSQFSSKGTAYRFFFNTQFIFFILGEDGRKIKADNIRDFSLYDGVRVSYINKPNKKHYITQVHWKDFQQKLSGIVQVKNRQFYFIPRNEKKDKIHLLNIHPVLNMIPELRNYNFFKKQQLLRQRQMDINKQLIDYLFMVKVIGLPPSSEVGYACWFEGPYYKEELFEKLQKLQKKRKFVQEDCIQGKEETDDQVEDDRLDINSENDKNEDDQISISEDEISYEIKFPILELKESQLQSKKRIENLFKEFGIEKDLSKKENFKKGFKEIMKKQDSLAFKLYIKRFMNLNKAHFPYIAKHLETIEKKNEKKKIDKNELRKKIMQKIKFYEKMFFTAFFYFLQNKQEQNKKSNKAQKIINMMQSYVKSTGKILPLPSPLQISKIVFGDKNEIQNQFKQFLKTNSRSKLFKWNNPIRSYSAIITQRIISQNKQAFNHLLSWDEVLAKEELNKWQLLRFLIKKNLSLIQKQVTKQERILYREINNEVDKINFFEKTRLELEGRKKINLIRIPQQQYGQGKFWAYHEIFDVQAFDVSPKLFKELDKFPYYHEFPLFIEVNLFKFPNPFNKMLKQT